MGRRFCFVKWNFAVRCNESINDHLPSSPGATVTHLLSLLTTLLLTLVYNGCALLHFTFGGTNVLFQVYSYSCPCSCFQSIPPEDSVILIKIFQFLIEIKLVRTPFFFSSVQSAKKSFRYLYSSLCDPSGVRIMFVISPCFFSWSKKSSLWAGSCSKTRLLSPAQKRWLHCRDYRHLFTYSYTGFSPTKIDITFLLSDLGMKF